ncbi:MAG TPA: (Fe-S)-binding protein [Candidatus Kapabacteria bacterium]|nr:(Fe-S)-binding protein [Candidatus Kapabacteria bacterium]
MTKKLTDIDEIAAVCSDCGSCLHACPVYNSRLLEPDSPRGKVNIIKALRDGRLKPNALNKEFIYRCMLCGSCQHICTKGVDFTKMMIDYRNTVSKGSKIPLFKKIILYFYQSIFFKKLSGLVDLFSMTSLRKRLAIPRRRPAKLKKIMTGAKGQKEKQYDILLFPGCVLMYFYPAIIEKIYNILTQKGFSVVIPKHLQCCGYPFISQGWGKKFNSLRKKNSDVFSQYNFKYLVASCCTCVTALKDYYDLKNIEIYELTEFFYRFIKDAAVDIERFTTPKESGKKRRVTWHDPCHHLKLLGLGAAPRFFMEQLGENFIDDKSALCCGFGGIFSVGFPAVSKQIFQRKEEKLDELEVDTVVTACPGCYLQLRERLGPGKEVLFFSDLFL